MPVFTLGSHPTSRFVVSSQGPMGMCDSSKHCVGMAETQKQNQPNLPEVFFDEERIHLLRMLQLSSQLYCNCL